MVSGPENEAVKKDYFLIITKNNVSRLQLTTIEVTITAQTQIGLIHWEYPSIFSVSSCLTGRQSPSVCCIQQGSYKAWRFVFDTVKIDTICCLRIFKCVFSSLCRTYQHPFCPVLYFKIAKMRLVSGNHRIGLMA